MPGRRAEDVAGVVRRIRLEGDAALRELAGRRDGAVIRVDAGDVEAAARRVPGDVTEALASLAGNLRATCERQMPLPWRVLGEPAGELVVPLARVGVVAPDAGARAGAVLAGAVPARAAGVDEVAVAAAPGSDGDVPDVVLAACAEAGVDEVYALGGATAVAALAYGTESVRPVDKVVGGAGAGVAAATREVADWVGTDAGGAYGELAIVAGEDAAPALIASDLLGHAEGAPHGLHALVTWSRGIAEAVIAALELAVLGHSRGNELEGALTEGGCAVLVRDLNHALDTTNALAPARLALHLDGVDEAMLERVRSAGAILVGAATPPLEDLALGLCGLMPGGGAARWASGIGVRDFVRTVYIAEASRGGLGRTGPPAAALARAEGLDARAGALEARLG
jgi:histidinol dehydrogenase